MEGVHEIQALRFWDGNPTVRLLEADEDVGAMLLERCEPGTVLRQLPEPEQDVVIAGLLRRLWRVPTAPHPFCPLAVMTAYWAADRYAHGHRHLHTDTHADGHLHPHAKSRGHRNADAPGRLFAIHLAAPEHAHADTHSAADRHICSTWQLRPILPRRLHPTPAARFGLC
jgi:hypothetical protein